MVGKRLSQIGEETPGKRVKNNQDNTWDALSHFTGCQSSSGLSNEHDSNIQPNSNVSTHFNDHSCEIMSIEEDSDELLYENNPIHEEMVCRPPEPLQEISRKVWKIKTIDRCAGTGFLYKIVEGSQEFCGLFTNNHVIGCYKCFDITLTNEKLSPVVVSIKKDDVDYFFTDCVMDVTFLVFNKKITNNIRNISNLDCFDHLSSETKGDTDIFVFGHPLGHSDSWSQGKLLPSGRKLFDNIYDIRYKLSTLGGSSGSPLVTNEGDLLGIHKSVGTTLDCLSLNDEKKRTRQFGEDNKGTRMEVALNLIKKHMKLYDELQNCEDNSTLPDEQLVLEEKALCVVSDSDNTELGQAFLCEISFLSTQPKLYGLLSSSHVIEKRKYQLPQTNSSTPEYAWTPKYPLTLKFQHSPRSNIRLEKDHVLLECIDGKFHVTFLLIKDEGLNIFDPTNHKFLPISNKDDNVFPSDVLLLSRNTGDCQTLVKIKQTKCDKTFLFTQFTNLPGEEGTPILNENLQVIGIRRTCGPKFVFGTYVAVGDTVMNMIFDKYQLRPRTIQNMSIQKRNKLSSCMTNLCNIYATKTMKDGTQKNLEGSGFLCSILTSSGDIIKGLLTTKIMIDERTKFQLVILNDNQRFIHYIFPNDIRWMFSDDDLYISFVAFRESFLDRLEISNFLKTSDVFGKKKEIIAISGSIINNKLYERIGILKEINGTEISPNGTDFYHTAEISPNGTGSPLLNNDLKVVGIHRGKDSNVMVATWMKYVIERVEEESSKNKDILLKSGKCQLTSLQNIGKCLLTGLLCCISSAGNRILNGLLIPKHIDETTDEITIPINEGSHKLKLQSKDLFRFEGNPGAATFIQLSQSKMDEMTKIGQPFLSIYRHEFDDKSSIWINFQDQEKCFGNMSNLVDNIQRLFLAENSLLSNEIDECIETRNDGDGVTNSDEHADDVTKTMTCIVHALSEAFPKFNEWSVKIGPLNDDSPDQVYQVSQKYMDKHWYVEKSEKYQLDGDYVVLKIRSRGLKTVPISGKWQNCLRKEIRPSLIDEHPGVVWIKRCGVIEDSSDLQIICIAQPDNGLPDYSDDYCLVFDNQSLFNLLVLLEDNPDRHWAKETANNNKLIFGKSKLIPQNKRYVKVTLQLCKEDEKPFKQTWFYTWKNCTWMVTNEGIYLEGGSKDLKDYSDNERVLDWMTGLNDYKWVFCNQIKYYEWEILENNSKQLTCQP